jgi:hypothetical protein
VAIFGRRLGERNVVQLAVGAVADGELRGEGSVYDVEPGFLISVSAARRFLGDDLPFLTVGFTYGMSFASTSELLPNGREGETASLSASDARMSLLFGYTVWDRWSPYLAARGFGGPVRWERAGEDRTGSDRHHYALGFGSSVALPEAFTLTFEATAVGERTLAWALTKGF